MSSNIFAGIPSIVYISSLRHQSIPPAQPWNLLVSTWSADASAMLYCNSYLGVSSNSPPLGRGALTGTKSTMSESCGCSSQLAATVPFGGRPNVP